MTILAILIVSILAALLILYYGFPGLLFDMSIAAIRRRGGMTVKSLGVGEFSWPYLEGGPPDAEPIVLVHGFGGDKDNWSTYAPFLTGRYRLICPDLPGFGDHVDGVDRDYRAAAQAERLKQFLDALGIAKCHLGGNSMGGWVALRFALDFPEQLHSLTLIDSAGVAGAEESPLQEMAARGEKPFILTSLADVDRFSRFVMHKPPFIPRQFKRILLADKQQRAPFIGGIFAQLIGDLSANPLNDRLGEINRPTLIIWGRHDRLTDPSCVPVLQEAIAGSEAVIFENVGHVPMIESPKETAGPHLAFLARHGFARHSPDPLPGAAGHSVAGRAAR